MHLQSDKPIAIAGDWHSSYSQAAKVVDWAGEHGAKIIIQVGDFGIWYNDKPFLNKLEQRLEIHGQTLYFIDGNHEDFVRLYEKPVGENGTRKVRSNIFHLPRGFRFTINTTSFLALGGAASIDRKHRVLNRSYWEEELLTEEDVDKAVSGGYADVMLCHDSPSSLPNTVTDDVMGQMRAGMSFGVENLNRCTYHRQTLDRAFRAVKPQWLFHGHYHESMSGAYAHEDGSITNWHGLDEGVAKMPRHAVLFNTKQ